MKQKADHTMYIFIYVWVICEKKSDESLFLKFNYAA